MQSLRLRSGRRVIIRPIRRGDGPALEAAYDRLSPESKYNRFLALKPHLSSAETRYLVEIDGCNHVALVANPVDRPERIVAVARFVRLPERPEAAEFAVAVGDDYQRDGLGLKLLELLGEEAIAHGVTRFHGTMLATNIAAHRLVRAAAGTAPRGLSRGIVHDLEFEIAPSQVPGIAA